MSKIADTTQNVRRQWTEHKVSDFIVKRSSPRAMNGKPISEEQLMELFEAARWAPSSFNRQPWNFVYALRETPEWTPFFSALEAGNQKWCDKAAALVVIVSNQHDPVDPSNTYKTASFDCGSAWENVCLQGVQNDLVVHGMEGFDKQLIAGVIQPKTHQRIEMMFAVGNPVDSADERISDRKPLEDFVFKGKIS